MKVIQITESKLENLAECAEKMLHYGGKVMTCIDELCEGGYSEEGYGERGGYGERMGRRQNDWDDAPDMTRPPMMRMGYRRRASNGRYM